MRAALDQLRRAARITVLIWSFATLAVTAWLLSQSPFAQPLIARSTAEAQAALEAAVARRATPEWLEGQLREALATEELIRLDMLLEVAADLNRPPPPSLQAEIDALRATRSGLLAAARSCGHCMMDITRCDSLTMIAACTMPFEMSPAGDAAAVLRQTRRWFSGDEVDEVEAALASVGLAATVSGPLTLGGSLTLKGAATILRITRKAGTLTPAMNRALIKAARGPNPTAELSAIAADLRGISKASSPSDALLILRHADSPEDLRGLARISEIKGTRSRHTIEVLGRSDSLRLLHRLADITIAAAGMILLLLGQIASLLAAVAKLILGRLLKRPPRTTLLRG